MSTQAPEILRIPVADLDTSVLPPGAPEPGTEAFETAVMLHFTSRYAARVLERVGHYDRRNHPHRRLGRGGSPA